jgi:hypothetical protein
VAAAQPRPGSVRRRGLTPGPIPARQRQRFDEFGRGGEHLGVAAAAREAGEALVDVAPEHPDADPVRDRRHEPGTDRERVAPCRLGSRRSVVPTLGRPERPTPSEAFEEPGPLDHPHADAVGRVEAGVLGHHAQAVLRGGLGADTGTRRAGVVEVVLALDERVPAKPHVAGGL